jgi:hypothetical protein
MAKTTEPKLAESFYLGLPDYQEKLSDPRFRYVMTAQIISSRLGEGSDERNASLPLI